MTLRDSIISSNHDHGCSLKALRQHVESEKTSMTTTVTPPDAEGSRAARPWRLELPGVDPVMLTNEALRAHHMEQHKANKAVEAAVRKAWDAQKDQLPPVTGPVVASITWLVADKKVRDSGGVTAWGKAAIDALCNLGVLEEDNYRYVTHELYGIELDPDRAGLYLELIPNPLRTQPMPQNSNAMNSTSDTDPPTPPDDDTTPRKTPRRTRRAAESTMKKSMLVMGGERPDISGAERQVLTWLQDPANQMSGVALSGVWIPRVGGSPLETDLLLIMPTGCVVVEIKGTPPGHDGAMSCPANDRWVLEGAAEAVKVNPGYRNPLDQLSARVYATKDLVRELGGDRFVPGVVVVVPNGSISLNRTVMMPPGCDVWLGTGPKQFLLDLRNLTERHRQPWDVETALTLLYALEVTSITRDDLINLGFPTEPSASHEPVADDRSRRSPAPVTAADVFAPRTPALSERLSTQPREVVSHAPQASNAPQPFTLAPARSQRRPSTGVLLFGAATIVAVSVVIAGVAQRVHESPTTTTNLPGQSQGAPAPSEETPVATPSPLAPPAAPHSASPEYKPPQACFPFQQRC
ncbi:nuclease-related domain-containing protein [Nocardia asiatica]|uniref:nuclease-related domain-containing protein n=1 Tax=Nocardia asiatica TaxID=209252 RepID=UPI0012FAA446|nr:nuclease-related domain-containing protein [Nocardia asiatica]